jgi:hypothetical protein
MGINKNSLKKYLKSGTFAAKFGAMIEMLTHDEIITNILSNAILNKESLNIL